MLHSTYKGRAFEIPYNFDIQWSYSIDYFMRSFNLPFEIIDCIYFPLYLSDGYGVIRNNNYDNRVMSEEDYIKHIDEINKYFPNKIQLLIQNDVVLPNDRLEFYHSLGINKFCPGNYEQSRIIRDKYPDSEIIASITMGIYDYELPNHPEYKDVFDGLILPFQYTRNLDAVNNLPDGFDYRLICNHLSCSPYCPGVTHWSAPVDANGIQRAEFCPAFFFNSFLKEDEKQNVLTLIKPQDLDLFKKIRVWKLLDRGSPTSTIKMNLGMYAMNNMLDIKKVDDSNPIDYNSYPKYLDMYNEKLLTESNIKDKWKYIKQLSLYDKNKLKIGE